MEKHFKLTTTLFAPPVTEIIPLAKAQIGFMNMFALPLFQGVTDIMPPMKYCVDELLGNIKSWEDRISEARLQQHTTDSPTADGTLSPRSMSVAVTSDANQTQNDLRVSAMMNNSTSLINSILSKNAFTRELRDEGAPLGLYNSLPDVQKTNLCPEEDRDPTQDPNLPYFGMYSLHISIQRYLWKFRGYGTTLLETVESQY
jgi:3',5'-cyclic-nucleotide phosphodiesterase